MSSSSNRHYRVDSDEDSDDDELVLTACVLPTKPMRVVPDGESHLGCLWVELLFGCESQRIVAELIPRLWRSKYAPLYYLTHNDVQGVLVVFKHVADAIDAHYQVVREGSCWNGKPASGFISSYEAKCVEPKLPGLDFTTKYVFDS
jgi:hypothetical protein